MIKERVLMKEQSLCPELHYRHIPQGVMITACFGTDGRIYLPEEIEGVPVTMIAPYTFSGSRGEEEEKDEVLLTEDVLFTGERRRLAAEDVTEVHLPRYVREIGSYAFYRCRNMRKLSFHDKLPSIGGGALTGCRFQEVDIYLHTGEKSALKSILDEIRFAMHVRFHYEGGSSEILFPEHYEEAVENTPARILYTSHHGAGGYYRQCFYDRELDYKKYDALLPRAVAEEDENTVVKLSLLRLLFPYKLSEAAKASYRNYVMEHIETAVRLLIEEEDTRILAFLSENDYWSEQALTYGIAYAGTQKKPEILSVLMDEKYRRFPGKKKTFEL